MEKLLVTILVLIIIGCTNTGDSTAVGKSRIERVEELPYRNLTVGDDLIKSIEHDIDGVLKEIATLDSLQLLYLSKSGELGVIYGNWRDEKDLVDQSYLLWKNDSISSTFTIYPSFTQDATTGEKSKIYVVEVENEKLTGTCRMFFDTPTPKQLEELSYTDRN